MKSIELYWNSLPTSPSEAMSYDELSIMWKQDKRRVREILHKLSVWDDGTDLILIRSTKGGFYRTENPSLIAEYRKEVYNRGRAVFACLTKINRVLRRDCYQYSMKNNIRLLRKEKGILQSDLAEKVGISAPLLSLIEQGTVLPTADTVNRIADILGCSSSEVAEVTI